MYKNSKHTVLFPLLLAAGVVLGLVLGQYLGRNTTTSQLKGMLSRMALPNNKLSYTLSLIENQYVDSVSMDSLAEHVIPMLVKELDPHSVYIPAAEMQALNEPLEGEFDGIGVVFNMATDTVIVLNVIPQGPSDKAGVKAGDRIVEIGDSLVAGRKIPQNNVVKMLRGPRGTTVRLGLERQGISDLVEVEVVRGVIPIRSIESAFRIADGVGYVKLGQFARTTFDEFRKALASLRAEGVTKLIFDLRGNTGGFLDQAIAVANEFLHEGQLIVYTEDRRHEQLREYADGKGSAQDMEVVVLIDEGSASSSEILAGALQDNDRGTVVGRRSFGKGLVQQPIDFSDGSAIRLTIARYYTPAGRCIQRPYESGKDRNYELDLFNRYEHGEFFSRDSIKQNENELYYTSLGRPVYGGGGIMPDIFVPQDTTGVTSYLSTAINRGLTIQFTFQYTDNNRKKLSQYETEEELLNYLRHQGLVEQFVRFAESKGLKRRNILIQKSYKLLEKNIYGNIIYNMLGLEAYLQYFNKTDATVNKGIEILEKGEAFPKAPVAVEEEDTKDKKNEKKKRTAQAYRIVEDPTLYFDYAEASIS